MRRTLAVALLLLANCLPAAPWVAETCERINTSNTEFVEYPNFDFLSLEGQPVELTFYSPLSSCPGDPISVRIEGTDSDSVSFLLEPSAPPMRIGADLVEARATFTPPGPGLFTFRASFEPSLGVRTVYVVSARVPTMPLSGVGVPSSCGLPWPLSADTIACELGTGETELTSSDGGRTSFEGSALVAVGPVTWSVTTRGVLERRELMGGRLALTHQFPSISLEPLTAEHGTEFALRMGADGRPVILSTDTGPATTAWGPPAPNTVLWVHPLGVTSRPCQTDACIGLALASDPQAMWIKDRFQLVSMPRPLQRGTFGVLQFPAASEVVTWRSGPFERIPFWLRTEQGVEVLLSMDLGEPQAIALPRAEVLNVGRDFLALRASDGGVLLTHR